MLASSSYRDRCSGSQHAPVAPLFRPDTEKTKMPDQRIAHNGYTIVLEDVDANGDLNNLDELEDWIADNLVAAVLAAIHLPFVNVEQADVHEAIREGFQIGIEGTSEVVDDESDPDSISTIEKILGWIVFQDAALDNVQERISNGEEFETEDVLNIVKEAVRKAIYTNMTVRLY